MIVVIAFDRVEPELAWNDAVPLPTPKLVEWCALPSEVDSDVCVAANEEVDEDDDEEEEEEEEEEGDDDVVVVAEPADTKLTLLYWK